MAAAAARRWRTAPCSLGRSPATVSRRCTDAAGIPGAIAPRDEFLPCSSGTSNRKQGRGARSPVTAVPNTSHRRRTGPGPQKEVRDDQADSSVEGRQRRRPGCRVRRSTRCSNAGSSRSRSGSGPRRPAGTRTRCRTTSRPVRAPGTTEPGRDADRRSRRDDQGEVLAARPPFATAWPGRFLLMRRRSLPLVTASTTILSVATPIRSRSQVARRIVPARRLCPARSGSSLRPPASPAGARAPCFRCDRTRPSNPGPACRAPSCGIVLTAISRLRGSTSLAFWMS